MWSSKKFMEFNGLVWLGKNFNVCKMSEFLKKLLKICGFDHTHHHEKDRSFDSRWSFFLLKNTKKTKINCENRIIRFEKKFKDFVHFTRTRRHDLWLFTLLTDLNFIRCVSKRKRLWIIDGLSKILNPVGWQ